ncbi:MAG: preprotein translocase subunit SecE [Mycobacterium sp.]
MSDERDGADAAGEGSDDGDTGSQTAVVTRPQRPTGKRSRPRADDFDSSDIDDAESGAVELGVDDDADKKKTKKAKKQKKDTSPGRNPFVFVWNYIKAVVGELRKVIWPNRKQMVSYTTVMMVFLTFMVTLISFVDIGLHKLVLWVFG